MIFLLDTNAFNDLMRKHAKGESPLTSLTPSDRVIMGPIVRGEICYGIATHTKQTMRGFEKSSGPAIRHYFLRTAPRDSGGSLRQHQADAPRKGLTPDENDFGIAATPSLYPRHGSLVTETFSRSKACPSAIGPRKCATESSNTHGQRILRKSLPHHRPPPRQEVPPQQQSPARVAKINGR